MTANECRRRRAERERTAEHHAQRPIDASQKSWRRDVLAERHQHHAVETDRENQLVFYARTRRGDALLGS
ncbi:hypothetical protein ACWD8I_12040 [Micromonospora arida]